MDPNAVRLVLISGDCDLQQEVRPQIRNRYIVEWRHLSGVWREHRDKVMQSANILWIDLRHFHAAEGTKRDRRLAERMLSYTQWAEIKGMRIAMFAPKRDPVWKLPAIGALMRSTLRHRSIH